MKLEKLVLFWSCCLIGSVAVFLISPLIPWPAGLRKEWSAGDWASWAQAVGAIAAILVAVAVAAYPIRQQMSASRGLAILFCTNAVEEIMRLHFLADAGNFKDMDLEAKIIDELLKTGQRIQLELLGPRSAREFSQVLMQMVRVKEVATDYAGVFEGEDRAGDIERAQAEFSRFIRGTTALIGFLPDRLGHSEYAAAYWAMLARHDVIVPPKTAWDR